MVLKSAWRFDDPTIGYYQLLFIIRTFHIVTCVSTYQFEKKAYYVDVTFDLF